MDRRSAIGRTCMLAGKSESMAPRVARASKWPIDACLGDRARRLDRPLLAGVTLAGLRHSQRGTRSYLYLKVLGPYEVAAHLEISLVGGDFENGHHHQVIQESRLSRVLSDMDRRFAGHADIRHSSCRQDLLYSNLALSRRNSVRPRYQRWL